MLSSKLCQREAENEALNAEKSVLLDKLAIPIRERPAAASRGWFSKGANGSGGSMQLLVDTNAKLMIDNHRIQILNDVKNW